MHNSLNQHLWQQFGASIDMLENVITLCPAEHWNTDQRFWYNAYHCLFFLDYYSTKEPVQFAPPPPFSLSEFEDRMPERVYTKDELLNYLQTCRAKCQTLLSDLSAEELINNRWINSSNSMNYSVFEICLYNMRHVQHHAAQLNLLLRQNSNDAPQWVFRAKDNLI